MAASAQLHRLAQPDYERYDIRDDPRVAKSLVNQPAADIASSNEQLSGSLYSLDGPLTGPQPGDPTDIARQFLQSGPPSARQIAAPGLDLQLAGRSRSHRAGLTHLRFQPTHAGIPYFDSDLRVDLDDLGRIWRVTRKLVPVAPTAEPQLSAAQAAQIALATLAPSPNPVVSVLRPASGTERRTTLASSVLEAPAPASLTWFVLGQEALPAWQMYLELGGLRAYWVVVDAVGGKILFSRNLTQFERPEGTVFRAPDRPNPLKGPQSLEPLTGWPPTWGDCPSDIYPPAFRSGAQQNHCWVSDQQTTGNNADVCLDLDGDNLCDGRGLGPQGRFSFPFTDAYDRLDDPSPDRNAALTNAFYWANVLHDWLYRLGFDEAAGNFQNDNFGRGGAAGDALRIDVQDPEIANNAVFTTAPDGIAPRMELGLFSGLRRDAAFDADIMAHEYVHGLTIRMIGGPDAANVLSMWQSGAMAEGWSDAYAASLTGDPVLGEYVTRNPATGIRTVAYNNSPYTFGMFGTLRPTVIPNSGGMLLQLPEVHHDGEIWATMLWDLRQALGKDEFEQAITTALPSTPSRPSMLDGRDAILQAVQTLGAGGESYCRAWGVFAARGLGATAAINPVQSGQANDTALSVFESFDTPAACGGSPPAVGSLLLEEGAESAATAWTPGGQWHRTTRRAGSGAFSWWYGQEATGTYDTGARNRGSLTSPPIDLGDSSGAKLEWDQLLRTEGFNHPIDLGGSFGPYLNADSGRVMVSTDGGSSWTVLSHIAQPTPGNGFAHYQINLSRFGGQTVRLRFDFDTFDAEDNQHEGWFVDNIRIERLGPGPQELRADPGSLSFAATAGGPSPTPKKVTISTQAGSGTGDLVWTAAVTQGSAWLSLLPASGRAPSSAQVSITSLGLAPGDYHGEIRVYEFNGSEAALTIGVTLTVAAPAGPLATWSFDEPGRGPGIGVSDVSARAHQGLTAGSGTDSGSGVLGNARAFDGATGYVDVPASVDFAAPRFTLRTWVKLESYPGVLGVIVAALSAETHQGWFLGVLETGNVVLMTLQPSGQALWLVSRRPLEPGGWHSITASVDWPGGEATIYLDGEQDATGTFSGGPIEAALPLTIGRASWWDGYYLHFAIDETRLDAGVWSAAQISADLRSFSPPPPEEAATPLAQWWFEETTTGPGATLTDSSGRGHDAVTRGPASDAVPGVAGNARAFHGSDSARIAPHADFASPGFTFTTWIRLDAYPQGWGVVFADFDGDFRGWFTGVNSDGRVIFSLWGQPSSSAWVLSGRRLDLGGWHQVAVSFDDLTRRAAIYIDGQLDRTFLAPGFTPQQSAAPVFAKASWFDGYYLACVLDEAKLFAVALSEAAVRLEFDRPR